MAAGTETAGASSGAEARRSLLPGQPAPASRLRRGVRSLAGLLVLVFLAWGCGPGENPNSATQDAVAEVGATDGAMVDATDVVDATQDTTTDAPVATYDWSSSGFASWKPSSGDRLSRHGREVAFAATGSREIALQSSCNNGCKVRVVCIQLGSKAPTEAFYDFDADAVHDVLALADGTFRAVGSIHDKASGYKSLQTYWSATIDGSTCTFSPTTSPVPADSWLYDVLPVSADASLVLVGRTEDAEPESVESPWIVGTGALSGLEARVGQKQGLDGQYYQMHSMRLFGNGVATAMVGQLGWGSETPKPVLESQRLWTARVDPKLEVQWMGELPGSEGASDADGASILDGGDLLISWQPHFEAADPVVHSTTLENRHKARFVARYTEDGKLVWKTAYNQTYPELAWQPLVEGAGGSVAIIDAHETPLYPKRYWRVLSSDGAIGGAGPTVPALDFATGVRIGNTLALAWLDGDTLHVEHHAWPPKW